MFFETAISLIILGSVGTIMEIYFNNIWMKLLGTFILIIILAKYRKINWKISSDIIDFLLAVEPQYRVIAYIFACIISDFMTLEVIILFINVTYGINIYAIQSIGIIYLMFIEYDNRSLFKYIHQAYIGLQRPPPFIVPDREMISGP